MSSLHGIKFFTTWLGLSTICAYPANAVRETYSCSVELVISFFHHLERQVLQSPVTNELIEISSFLLLKSKLKFAQKFSNLSWHWLAEQ